MGYYEELAAVNAKEGKGKRLSVTMLKLEQDKPLIGRFVERELIKSTKPKMPDYYRYTFETSEGPVTCMLSGSYDGTTGEKLTAGSVYKITFKGKIDLAGGHTWKAFETLELEESEAERKARAGFVEEE